MMQSVIYFLPFWLNVVMILQYQNGKSFMVFCLVLLVYFFLYSINHFKKIKSIRSVKRACEVISRNIIDL